jgi:fructokinase
MRHQPGTGAQRRGGTEADDATRTARHRIGIDLGGTKTEAIVLDEGGRDVVRRRIPTPRSYDGTLAALAELVAAVEADAACEPGSARVGVGIPGSEAAATGLIRNANSTWLNGRPLRHDLSAALQRPVRLMNDANCFALSEATDGAGSGCDVVFGVILGTGVGGGVVVGGRCLHGANGIAGEWGHNPLPWPEPDELPGPACYCGRRGCIETWVSGPGLWRDHLHAGGADIDTTEIVARAIAGGALAAAALSRYRQRLGRALASVINVLDPDVVVLGGGMSNIPGLAEDVGDVVAPWVFADSMRTPIRRNVHGDSSGVRGAAWLWPV